MTKRVYNQEELDNLTVDELNNLRELDCSNTNVSILPNLPKLEVLYCRSTNVSTIPNLPNLSVLGCSDTNVSAIPNLPKLEVLYCSDTKVTIIPNLPNLVVLYCSRTKVTTIPNLPKLVRLYCSSTPVPIKEVGTFILCRLNDLQLQIGCQIKYIKDWLEMSKKDIEDLDIQAKLFNDTYRNEVLEFIELTNSKVCKEK